MLIKNISYSTIAGVVRQCDSRDNVLSLGASTAKARVGLNGGDNISKRSRQSEGRENTENSRCSNRRGGGRRSLEEIAQMKAVNPCHQCNKFSHWSNEHNDDGSLKPGTVCNNTSEAAEAALSSSCNKNASNNC